MPNLAAWNRRSPSQVNVSARAWIRRRVGRDGIDLGLGQIDIQPFVDECHVLGREHDFLGVLDQAVVLGVEDVVDGGEADVLVCAAVAGDEVGIEKLVVVDRRIVAGVSQADFDVAVGDSVRDRVMRDVRQEGGVDADRPGNSDRRGRGAGDDDVVRRVWNAVGADARDDLGETLGIGNEVAVLVGAQQRYRADVLVGQEDAKHLGLLLDLAPGGHAAGADAGSVRIGAASFNELAGRVRDAVASSAYWRRNTWWEACEV